MTWLSTVVSLDARIDAVLGGGISCLGRCGIGVTHARLLVLRAVGVKGTVSSDFESSQLALSNVSQKASMWVRGQDRGRTTGSLESEW